MTTLGTAQSSSADIRIPELIGVASKRKSLSQFQGNLHRQIDVIHQDCRLADPQGDGTDPRCNQQMINILDVGLVNLEVAFKKWNLRYEQLIEEDTNEDNLAEYKNKWGKIPKDYSDAKALIINTLHNIKKTRKISPGESGHFY